MIKKTLLVGAIALAMSGVACASGFYVGGGLGASVLKNTSTESATVTDEFSPDHPTNQSAHSHNENLGGNVTVLTGYAWDTVDQYYVGLEAFDNASNAQVSTQSILYDTNSANLKVKMNNVYGLRLLPGYHITPDTVAYGILGVVRGNEKLTVSESDGSGSSTYNLKGYQVGLGAMTNLSKNVALRGDVIYTGYQSQHFADDEISNGFDFSDEVKIHPSTTEANVDLLYKFG
jgi:outer membrane immunogenic protein